MNRVRVQIAVLTLALLGMANTAFGHHPPRFERCKLFTVAGELERVEWVNPHVLLLVRSADGEGHELGWLDLQSLSRAGIEPTTLGIGDRVIVQGGTRPDDLAHKPVLVSRIRRASDGWEWSQPVQGC